MWLLRRPAGRLAILLLTLVLAGIFFWFSGHAPNRYTILLAWVGKLAKAAEGFREREGRYPETREEWLAFGTGGGPVIDAILESSRRLPPECALSEVFIRSGEGMQYEGPLLLITGHSARVEIYRGGRFGMSRCLHGPGEPRAIKGVRMLPNEPWTSYQQ